MNKKEILKKIDKHLSSKKLSKQDIKELESLKTELIIANTEKRILYLLAILIKIVTGLFED